MKNSVKAGKILGFYWSHAWRYPRLVIGILTTLPLTVLVDSFLPPLILARVISRLASGNYIPGQVWSSFSSTLLLFGFLLLWGAVGWRVMDAFVWRLEGKVTRDLAERVYSHLLGQSANFHANTFGGSLVSQTNKLIGGYVRIADTTIYQTLQLISVILFTVIFLASRAPLFVILLLIFSAIYVLSAFYVTREVRFLGAKHASSESHQTGYLADSISNVMAIKSFSATKHENSEFSQYTNRTYNWLLDLMRANQKQMIYFGVFNRVIQFGSLLLAIVSVVMLKANVATAFLIFSYTSTLINQLWQFGNNSLRNYNRSLGDAHDMVEILHLQPVIKDPINPEKVVITAGEIELKDVGFMHDGANTSLFQHLNLHISPGEKVGLVGHSGSGKTSLTRILLRFSDIDSGEILIDGQNIAHITQDDLRSQIAYVPQEPLLFHRSLTDNILYGRQQASQDEVIEASKMAHAHEFVTLLPKGYDTLVGERGVKLSGGQRQRVAIARAMLKDAPILLLDEATSALDSESEVLIQKALWKLMEGRTAVVIAHRLSTVQKMDRIIVLDNGKIVEQGSHSELIKKKGVYAGLWAHQSGGFLED